MEAQASPSPTQLNPPSQYPPEYQHQHQHEQRNQPKPSFLSLPPELHDLIISHLIYPDLLSLKLSHPRFQALFNSRSLPTVHQRIAWILARGQTHLPIPQDIKTNFRTDAQFVQNPEVSQILRRRRLHLECEHSRLSRRGRLPLLRFTPGGEQRQQQQRLLCFVFEGHEDCPRLKALDEKRARRESTLPFRLWRATVTWPTQKCAEKWDEWDRPWCPSWLEVILRRHALHGALHLGLLVAHMVVLAVAVAAAIVLHVHGITLGWLWHTSLSLLTRWSSQVWQDLVQEFQVSS